MKVKFYYLLMLFLCGFTAFGARDDSVPCTVRFKKLDFCWCNPILDCFLQNWRKHTRHIALWGL